MSRIDWASIAFYVCAAIVGVAMFKYGCAAEAVPTAGQCGVACSPQRMRGFDPATGKCECQP